MQAKKFAADFKIPKSFKFSDTWCFKFKGRFGIRKLKICGERLSADVNAMNGFKESFFSKIEEKQLTIHQIYNCDESGLFIKMLPRDTLVHSGN